MAALEAALVLAIPASSTGDHGAPVDFGPPTTGLEHLAPKLFSLDKVRFDSNPFGVNAFRHPIVGCVSDYHIGSNGFSLSDSTLIAFDGVFWSTSSSTARTLRSK